MIRRLIILLLIVGCEEETTEPEDKAACLWETFNEKYNPPFTTFNYNYYCYNEFLKENDCIAFLSCINIYVNANYTNNFSLPCRNLVTFHK